MNPNDFNYDLNQTSNPNMENGNFQNDNFQNNNFQNNDFRNNDFQNNDFQNGNFQTGYSQSQYPNSQIPNSGYPNSGFGGYPGSQQPYPQSEMQFPVSEYAEEGKSKTFKVVITAIVVVLIVALAATLIVVLRNRNTNGMMPPPPPMGTMISVSENGATINGQSAEIECYTQDGKAYLKLEDIGRTAGYDYVREGNEIKLLSQQELAILTLNSTKVSLQDQTTKDTNSVEILKAPFEKDGSIYIYARDLSVFLKNTNVSYNSATETVEISIGMAGGPGGTPTMNGQPPQGGQPQGQPQAQGQPQGQPQGEPQGQGGGQSPQGGQPPQN